MKFLLYISEYSIPVLVFYVIIFAKSSGVSIFESFTEGAKEAFGLIKDICPNLIALMLAVSVFRESKALDELTGLLAPLAEAVGFPAPVLPLVFIKIFSSSAATGLLIDIFKQSGPDSFEGMLASLFLCCSETIAYTMAIYLGAVKVKKSRYILLGALISMAAGTIAAFLLIS